MVSFGNNASHHLRVIVCNHCQETLKKPKLDAHAQRCRNASFSCIDCSTDFDGTEYRAHTSCISEAEKYQKALYKPKKVPEPKVPEPIGKQLEKRKEPEHVEVVSKKTKVEGEMVACVRRVLEKRLLGKKSASVSLKKIRTKFSSAFPDVVFEDVAVLTLVDGQIVLRIEE